MSEVNGRPPEGCHHYDDVEQVPYQTQKYWQQRYDIFSRYDEGIWMTEDGWYGVTPEPVADVVASHVAESAPAEKTILIDAFAGLGGNTIAFARSGRWERIFAIEKDPQTLACAKHNAEIYGVSKKIWWIEGDCTQIIKKRFTGMAKTAVIFASPPWGGPSYRDHQVFDLTAMEPYNLKTLLDCFTKVSQDIVLYLPRTSDLNQLAAHVKDARKMQVAHYCMRGASKALCAYYGDWTA